MPLWNRALQIKMWLTPTTWPGFPCSSLLCCSGTDQTLPLLAAGSFSSPRAGIELSSKTQPHSTRTRAVQGGFGAVTTPVHTGNEGRVFCSGRIQIFEVVRNHISCQSPEFPPACPTPPVNPWTHLLPHFILSRCCNQEVPVAALPFTTEPQNGLGWKRP